MQHESFECAVFDADVNLLDSVAHLQSEIRFLLFDCVEDVNRVFNESLRVLEAGDDLGLKVVWVHS